MKTIAFYSILAYNTQLWQILMSANFRFFPVTFMLSVRTPLEAMNVSVPWQWNDVQGYASIKCANLYSIVVYSCMHALDCRY